MDICFLTGGWWFKTCVPFRSCLNGLYFKTLKQGLGVLWNDFPGSKHYPLKFAEMKVRPYH